MSYPTVTYFPTLFTSFKKTCIFLTRLFDCYLHPPNNSSVDMFQVYNIIPSISAITGVSPQRYLWRICVALHIGPRLLIASIYHAYYSGLATSNATSQRLLKLCYWLNIVEIASLCGVTYISNKENYRELSLID